MIQSSLPKPAEAQFPWERALLIFLVCIFLMLMVVRAWAGDDAFITIRVVDNFIHGYGPVYNISERVQAYTHPLWMILITLVYAVWRDPYGVLIVLSIGTSLAACIFAIRKIGRSLISTILGLAILLFSAAFVDYSNSGLENPLTHLLLAVFLYIYLYKVNSSRYLFWCSLVASLAACNRLDTLLIYLPALLLIFWQNRSKKSVKQLIAGQIPLILWELFSIFYYGFPFPNTYYAKLNAWIPISELVRQGLFYYLYSLENDPVTIFAILAGIVLAIVARNKKMLFMEAGIALYLVYILRIGGDFMGGRFLTPAVWMSALMFMDLNLSNSLGLVSGLTGAVIIFLGMNGQFPTFQFSSAGIGYTDFKNGIANERTFYTDNNLVNSLRTETQPLVSWRLDGELVKENDKKVIALSSTGLLGFYAGPQKHIVDKMALVDPLLARLPMTRDPNWRIGHFERKYPEGYLETLLTGTNYFSDPNLSVYYEALHQIVSGNVFDPERLTAIFWMNTGFYDHLLPSEAAYFNGEVVFEYPEISTPPQDAEAEYQGAEFQMGGAGLRIDFATPRTPGSILIGVNGNSAYSLVFYRDGKVLGETTVERIKKSESDSIVKRLITVPDAVRNRGFDRIRLLPIAGDAFKMGYLTLLP